MKNMKRTSGLVAFVVVFSMLASLFVMPISVSAATNLAPTITGIDGGTISQTGGVKASDAAAEPKWERKNGNVSASFADDVVSITARGGWDVQSGLVLKNAPLKSGKTYKISVDLRGDAYSGGTSTASLYLSDVAGSNATYVGMDNVRQNADSNNVQVIGEISGRTQIGGAQLGIWMHVEKTVTIGTNAGGTGELGMDIGFSVGQFGTSPNFLYSFKNFEIVEITPFTGSAVANGSTGATFTFSNDLAEDAEESDFEVTTTAPGAKTPVLAVTTTGNVVEVTMSDYSDGTTYTISAKTDGVADEFGQNLSEAVSATVTTEAAPLEKIVPAITGISSAMVISHENVVKASDATEKPAWTRKNAQVEASYADGVVSVTSRGTYDPKSGLILKNAALESGKTYKISVDLRTDAFSNGRKPEGRDAAMYIADVEGSKATIAGSTGIYTGDNDVDGIRLTGEIGNRVRVATVGVTADWDWVHYEKVFTMGTNPEGTGELGADIGFAVGDYGNSNNFKYSFKNLEITELAPVTGSAVANGTNGATFTFSEDLAEDAEASDFTVTTTATDAKTPVLAVATTGNIVEVTMSDYSNSTDYTITATTAGVTGISGQNLSKPVSVTVTTEAAAPPPVDPSVPFDPDGEIVPEITDIDNNIVTFVPGVKASNDAESPEWVAVGTATALSFGEEDGENIVSVSSRDNGVPGAGIVLKNAALKSGKKYKISAEFRRDSVSGGSKSARFLLMDIAPETNKATITGGTNIRQEADGIKIAGEVPAEGNGVNLVNQDQWYTLEQTFVMGERAEGTKELGADVGFFVGQYDYFSDFDFSVKNFTIVELVPFTGEAVANGTNAATFTFSNELAEAAKVSDFTVTTTSSSAKTPALAVATSGKTVEVTMSDYSTSTTYTITATTEGLTDVNGQKLASPVSASVTTESAALPPVVEGDIVPVITGISHPTITQAGGVKASAAAAAPTWANTRPSNLNTVQYVLVEENGEWVVKITQRQQWAGDLSGIWLTNAALKSGKTYKVSVDLRTDAFTTGRSRRAGIYIEDIPGSKATIAGVDGIRQQAAVRGDSGIADSDVDHYVKGLVGDSVQLATQGVTSDWEWQHIERTFTMGTNPEGTAELGANIGFKVGDSGNYHQFLYSFKNFKIEEADPFTGTGAAKGKTGATFTFSNNIPAATADNFEVTTTAEGAKVPTLTVIPNGKTVDVVMSDYSTETEYTITAKANSLADEFGQKFAEAISVTVTTPKNEAPPAPPVQEDPSELIPASGYISGTITGVSDTGSIIGSDMKPSPDGAAPSWGSKSGAKFAWDAEAGAVMITERYSGNSNSGPVLNNAGLESGKTYRVSVEFRRDTAEAAGSVRIQIDDVDGSRATYKGGKNIVQDGNSVREVQDNMGMETPGEWYTLTTTFTLGVNTASTKELGANISFKVGANADSAKLVYSFRNLTIFEIPDKPLHIMNATPAIGSDDASINIGKIVLNLSADLAEDFNPRGRVKLFKGETDVTAELVSNVVRSSENNHSVEFNVGELENNTVYTVKIKDATDYIGRIGSDSYTFRTVKATSRKGFELIDSEGNVLDAETAEASDVAAVQVGVANSSNSTVKNPVFVYTVYDPVTNVMEQIGTSVFEEADYTAGEEKTLNKAVSGLENKRLALYVINSKDNTTFVGDAFVKDFTGEYTDFEPGDIISDSFTYDIDTDAGLITFAGKSDANADVPVILVKAGNGAAPDNSFYTNTKGELSSMLSESNLGDIVHFANAKSNANGNWSIVLPLTKDAAADTVYYAITTGGSLVDGFMASKVFVPSEETEEQAEAAINGAANAADLVEAIDDNDYILGLDTANAVYRKHKKDIADAILVMNGGGDYASDNFTDLAELTSFKSHFKAATAYYTRQEEALDAINDASVDSLKTVLETYSLDQNVLGAYGGEKLDFAAVYEEYAPYKVNRLVAGGDYADMTAFIAAFNKAVAAVEKEELSDPESNKPEKPSTQTKPTGTSGLGGGGGAPVPTTEAPKVEFVDPNALNDLGEAPWAEKSILNLVDLGVINGMGDGTFRPNGTVTREQFVKMLVLLFDLELSANASSFADVDGGAWYAPYVATAYEKGIVNGVSAEEFGVGQNISRQDLIVMVYRACMAKGLDITTESSVSFTDAADVADYAKEAVNTLAAAEIINGVSEGVFAPKDNTTRAQVAVILDRVYSI